MKNFDIEAYLIAVLIILALSIAHTFVSAVDEYLVQSTQGQTQ